MRKPFIALCLCISLFSCKNEEKTNKIDTNIEIENKEESYNQLKYTFNLPDTVIVNKPYQATIKFKSDFDTIIDPLQAGGDALKDSIKSRLIYFYYFEPFKNTMKPTELVLIDSAFVLNKYFELNNIIFTEKGEFVFCGLIKDEIMYRHYNEKGIRDSVHFDRLKQEIFKKVVVVDK